MSGTSVEPKRMMTQGEMLRRWLELKDKARALRRAEEQLIRRVRAADDEVRDFNKIAGKALKRGEIYEVEHLGRRRLVQDRGSRGWPELQEIRLTEVDR